MTGRRPTIPLGDRGIKYWNALTKLREMGPGDLLMIEEACRIADRLDKLDKLLSGDISVWARVYSRNDEPVDLHLDQAMGEARQHAAVLRQIIVSLDLPKSEPVVKRVKSGLDLLAASYAAGGPAGAAAAVDTATVTDIGSTRRRARTTRRAGA